MRITFFKLILGVVMSAVLGCNHVQEKLDYISVGDQYRRNVAHRILDEVKAEEFNEKYFMMIPIQEFRHYITYQFPRLKTEANFKADKKSYLVYSNVYGHSENAFAFAIDSTLGELFFILWYQPVNFKEKSMYYFHNNKLIERDVDFNLLQSFDLNKELSFDIHNVEDIGDGNFYTAAVHEKPKVINGDSANVVDFDFFKFNKKTHEKQFLFSASDVVSDSMLVPELFEETSPLYKAVDIYHWNWLQIDNNKMLINYAFCGLQQVDMLTKKVDWHWGYNHNTFSKIEGVGDLSGPYYTHHFNKISDGPHKGRYSYFENGSEAKDGKEFKPARARIFEIDETKNSINIVWEQVYDFASDALGSINVFDDYILVNVGMAFPIIEFSKKMEEEGAVSALDYYNTLYRPLIYLYDDKGNAISEYHLNSGFYSYIVSPMPRKKVKK